MSHPQWDEVEININEFGTSLRILLKLGIGSSMTLSRPVSLDYIILNRKYFN